MNYYRKLNSNIDQTALILVTFNNGDYDYLRTIDQIRNVLCVNTTSDTLEVPFPNLGKRKRNEVVGIEFLNGAEGTLTTIPDRFCMYFSNIKSDIIIPKSVTRIGDNFLEACTNFNSNIILNNVTQIGMKFLYQCTNFNKPLDLGKITNIGGWFLESCTSFNQHVELNKITYIAVKFMYNCSNFNNTIFLGSKLTLVGDYFCFGLEKMTNYIYINSKADIFISDSDMSFCVQNSSSPAYKTGIGIGGNYASDIRTLFPNRTTSPYYRKLR